MRFSINNVGKVSNGDLELDGITVLVGDNNMGKTTVGRALYCLFNSLYGIQDEVTSQRKRQVFRTVRRFFERFRRTGPSPWSIETIVDKIVETCSGYEELRKLIKDIYGNQIPEDEISGLEQNIAEVCELTDEEIYRQIIRNYFDSVFDGQYVSVRQNVVEARIEAVLGKHPVFLRLSANDVELRTDINIQHRAFFVDDSKVLDNWGRYRYMGGMSGLSETIRRNVNRELRNRRESSPSDSAVDDVMLGKVYDELLADLRGIIGGSFVFDDSEMLRFNDEGHPGTKIELSNVSEGVKSFGVLGVLLSLRLLRMHDVLILDEPEIHLHPEWQLKYAAFIVKLQERLKLTVLLTTHSSNFLFALQLYAERQGRMDVLNAYRIQSDGSDRNFSIIERTVDDGARGFDDSFLAFADAAGRLQMLMDSVHEKQAISGEAVRAEDDCGDR